MQVDTARVIEVFSSIQGEGPLIGVRQIFVRFVGCNIRCIYCDTPDSFVNPSECLVESSPGSREFLHIPNPLTVDQLMEVIQRSSAVPHHSVSLTGGEPLIHSLFLQSLLPRIRAMDLKVYLETNGILSSAMEEVLEWTDVVSMDIKLPSTLSPRHDFFTEHKDFLSIASTAEVFVKVVVAEDTPEYEIIEAARLVESVNPEIAMILQPVTKEGDGPEPPSPSHILHIQSLLSKILKDVRVIPQVHKLIGQY